MNKLYITSLAFIVALLAVGIFAPAYVMYLLVAIIFGLHWFMLHKLEKRLTDLDKKHDVRLAEAGNAITDTLRVIFDNLKKFNVGLNKNQGKITEHESRIRRIEQTAQKSNKANRLTKKVEITEDVQQPPKKIEKVEEDNE